MQYNPTADHPNCLFNAELLHFIEYLVRVGLVLARNELHLIN